VPLGATGPNGANAWDSVVIKIREADQENASMPDAKFQFKTVTSTAKDTKSTWRTAAGLVQNGAIGDSGRAVRKLATQDTKPDIDTVSSALRQRNVKDPAN
jgi:hypothetical protein